MFSYPGSDSIQQYIPSMFLYKHMSHTLLTNRHLCPELWKKHEAIDRHSPREPHGGFPSCVNILHLYATCLLIYSICHLPPDETTPVVIVAAHAGGSSPVSGGHQDRSQAPNYLSMDDRSYGAWWRQQRQAWRCHARSVLAISAVDEREEGQGDPTHDGEGATRGGKICHQPEAFGLEVLEGGRPQSSTSRRTLIYPASRSQTMRVRCPVPATQIWAFNARRCCK